MNITLTAIDIPSRTDISILIRCRLGQAVEIFLNDIRLCGYSYGDFRALVAAAQPNAGFGHPDPFQSRLYLELAIAKDHSWQSLLLRSFIISFKHLIASDPQTDAEVNLRTINDFACIENTGSLGPQPTIYFVPSPILTHTHAIRWLYEHNFLCRYNLHLDHGEVHRTYFVPFNPPKKARVFELGYAYPAWYSITKSYYAHVSTFARPSDL